MAEVLPFHRPPPTIAGRVPPHDLEAEAAVLSAALSDREALDAVRGRIEPEHFYSEQNQLIYTACRELAGAGQPIDYVTVNSWLRARELVQRVGGFGYLSQLVDASPAVAHVGAHARTVLERWIQRQAIARFQRAAAEGYGDVGGLEAWLDRVDRDVRALGELAVQTRAMNMAIGTAVAAAKLQEMLDGAGKLSGISTGIAALDDATAGMHAGDLVVLTAPSKGGKTALATSLALNVARQGIGVAVVSLEMPADQLINRAACSIARVNWHAVRLSKHTHGDLARLHDGYSALRALPLLIDDTRRVSMGKLVGNVEAMRASFDEARTPLGLVVVDYIQKIHGRDLVGPRATNEEALKAVAEQLVHLAERLAVPVLALAQTNNDGEIRESRAVLFEATAWWHLEVEKDASHRGARSAQIAIKAQRHAPAPAVASCWFHPAFVTFSDEERLT